VNGYVMPGSMCNFCVEKHARVECEGIAYRRAVHPSPGKKTL
jgi:hypothetical protein